MNFTVARWPENAEGCAQCRVAAGRNGFERRVREAVGPIHFPMSFAYFLTKKK